MSAHAATPGLSDLCATRQPAATQAVAKRVDSIQVLRGLAAAFVVFHHYALLVQHESSESALLVRMGLGELGAAGVDMFFVISGFIMVHTTKEKIGLRDARLFIAQRALRIYPLYWLWTTVLLVLWLSGLALRSHHYTFTYLLSSYALLPAFNGETWHPLLDQGWTLSFELLFYLVFTITLGATRPSHRAALIAALLVLLYSFGQLLPSHGSLRHLLTEPIMFEFLLGVAAAEIARSVAGRRERWKFAVSLLLVTSGTLLLLAFGTSDHSGWLRPALWGVPCFLIVLGAAVSTRVRTDAVWVYLGDASYSIYLTHGFVTMAVAVVLKRLPALRAFDADALIVICTLVTVPLAAVSYRWVERPLTRSVRALQNARIDGVGLRAVRGRP